jgi:hypothetical protein
MTQEEQQDTRESPALGGEVRFERADVEGIGDPAAAGTDPGVGDSPAEAQRRGEEEAGGAPIGPVVGAFVGAFVAAKLLGRLGGGDDE